MRVALVGYGKMGRAVEEIVLQKGHSCTLGLSSDADVCIDFSIGGAVEETALSIEIPWVLGTTGWEKEAVLPLVEKREIPLLYAPNFSLGMALFRKLACVGRSLYADYDMEGEEIHHQSKKDAPSGSALRLMEEIEGLTFKSKREGTEVGTHRILFKAAEEEVELTHRALDRRVFARGAVLAAEWLMGRKGIFTFDEMIEEQWNLVDSQQH